MTRYIAGILTGFLLAFAAVAVVASARGHGEAQWTREWLEGRTVQIGPLPEDGAVLVSLVNDARARLEKRAHKAFAAALNRCGGVHRLPSPGEPCIPKPEPVSPVSAGGSVASAPSGGMAGLICSVFGSTCEAAVSVASCESGLNPGAQNPSGASGLFQLMPSHWAGSFNPFDPVANTQYAYGLSNGGTDWGAWVCQP